MLSKASANTEYSKMLLSNPKTHHKNCQKITQTKPKFVQIRYIQFQIFISEMFQVIYVIDETAITMIQF